MIGKKAYQVVILAGTFATLMFAGMVLLVEMAVAVIIGLLLLSFVLLPIFLPALIKITEMKKKKNNSTE